MATHNQIQAEANKINAQVKNAEIAQRRQAANAAQRETNRSNREREHLTRRGQNVQALMSGLNTVGGALNTGVNIAKLIGSANDPSWYNKDAQLVKDVAQISFNTPARSVFELGTHLVTAEPSAVTVAKGVIPLGTQLLFTPTIGFSVGESSVANVAAKNIYSYIRYANSGSANYEPNDLMIYLLAMDSLYTAYAWGIRTYSIITHADRYNGYMPVDLAKLAGCRVDDSSASDWFTQIANVRAYLNMLRVRIGAFNVPSNFPYFNRHIWMCTNIFRDMNIRRSSYHLFAPRRVYKYTGDTIKYLQSVDFVTGVGANTIGMTFESYKQLVNSLLDALISDEDIGIIGGDILKAYGEGNMFTLAPIPEEFDVGYTYSEEVLSQIASATITPLMANTVNIGQSAAGLIISGTIGSDGRVDTPGFTVDINNMLGGSGTEYVITLGGLVNILKDSPTPDDIMVATRLMVNYSGTQRDAIKVVDCGSEIIEKVAIGYRSPDSSVFYDSPMDGNDYISSSAGSTRYVGMLTQLSLLAKLDWAPCLNVWTNVTGSKPSLTYTSRDYGNVAYISENTLANMHYVAILSEMAVPDIGTKTR